MALQNLQPNDDPRNLDERIDDLAKGRSELLRFGRHVPMRLGTADRVAFDRACELGYLVARKSQGALRRLWCHRADLLQVPDVLATPRSKFARVRCDLLQVGHDARLTEVVLARLALALAAYEFSGPTNWFSAARVPLDRVADVCLLFVRASAGDVLDELPDPVPVPEITEVEARQVDALARVLGVVMTSVKLGVHVPDIRRARSGSRGLPPATLTALRAGLASAATRANFATAMRLGHA